MTIQSSSDALPPDSNLKTGHSDAKSPIFPRQPPHLGRILEQIPATIATLSGPEHRFSFFNEGYLTLTANRARLGHSVAQCLPEVVEQGFIDLLDSVYQTGQPFIGRETPIELYQPATGQTNTYYLDFTYQPLLDEQQQTIGILVFVVDVTGQVQTRKQVENLQAQMLLAVQQQAEERASFQQVFEQTPAAICIQRGPSHYYQYVNPAYQNLFPDREFLGRTVAEALPETVPQGFVDLLDRVYQTGETFFGTELPVVLTLPDGSPSRTIYFNFTYQAYQEYGQVVGISTFAYDVTEQVLARQEQEVREQQLRDLFEQAPVAIAIFRGPTYHLEIVNPFMAALWERGVEQLVERPLREALPEGWGQGQQELLDGVRTSGQALVARAVPIQRGIGVETVYVNVVYQPLLEADGSITRIALVAINVTEQVHDQQRVQHLNAELLSANEKLTASNDELGKANRQLIRTNVDLDNFIYTASHDLKAPISNIEGLLKLMLGSLPPEVFASERLQKTSGLIADAVERFKRTITHLTEVTQLQKESNQPAVAVDLSKLIREVRLDLALQLEAAKAVLDIAVEGCPSIRFSEKNLRSIVYNLLSNAVKYCSPERIPLISIHCQLKDFYVVLTVSDNGLGIDLSKQTKLFAMFGRLHNHVEGSGVGLYMVKKMVENVGGKIEVESQLGIGSSFRVYFPVQ